MHPPAPSIRKDSFRKREFCNVFRLHVYRNRVGGEGGFLENTIRMNLPKGLPLGFGEICVDLWDFERGGTEVAFLLLIYMLSCLSTLLKAAAPVTVLIATIGTIVHAT